MMEETQFGRRLQEHSERTALFQKKANNSMAAVDESRAAQERAARREESINNSKLVKQARELVNITFKLWKSSANPAVKLLVDEMIHGILFVGYVKLNITYEEMFVDSKVLEMLNDNFSTAINGCNKQLPRRSPYSCLLQLIAELKGRGNPKEVKDEILECTKKLILAISNNTKIPEADQLIGGVICITHSEQTQQYGYGASISLEKKGRETSKLSKKQAKTTEKISFKKIWIDLSCVHAWHPHVSYTVMKWSRNQQPTNPFPSVEASCVAYGSNTLKELDPCASCCKLYSLKPGQNTSTNENLYGNCAETEAISELFRLRKVPLFDTPTLLEWVVLRHDTQRDLLKTLEGMGHKDFKADVVYEPRYIPISSSSS